VLFALFGGSCTSGRKRTGAPELPSDAQVQELLRSRIETQRRAIGITAGIVSSGEQRLIPFGRLNQTESRQCRADTIFELASVTKVFTALLLADMVQRREVNLHDPLVSHLPESVTIPERGGRQITLLDIATHTSGLPYWPGNLPQADQPGGQEALMRYTSDDLHEFLRTYSLPRDIGSRWEYSNVGYVLLGEALAHRTGLDFATLIRTRITGPLGMKDTDVAWSQTQRRRAATGHDTTLAAVMEQRAQFLAAAGGLHSSAEDMVRLLTALLHPRWSRLGAAFSTALAQRRPAEAAESDQTLGWLMRSTTDGEVALMLGGSYGFASAVAIDPVRRWGVVILSNSIEPVADLAMRVLRPGASAAAPAGNRAEIQLDPGSLQGYAGRYQSEAGLAFDVILEAGRLAIRFPGATPALRARTATEFFTDGGAEVTFRLDELGRAVGLELRAPSIPRISAIRVEPGR
jgi:CubicO group peptidase (beta-lactamase class C family)